MANETDVNFEYIPNQRYIVEIKSKGEKQSGYTGRMRLKKTARIIKKGLNTFKGFRVRIHDTKTGEVI